MDLRIFTEPQQGATYDDLLAVASTAERLGFGAFFRSDHYLGMGTDGLPGPTDAWVTLAGLARDTTTIRLGTLVTSATFRRPGPLAITVAGVDQMSGGRVELGLGAGWFDGEHRAYGIPFPDVQERFDRLEEQLAIVTGLWSTPAGERFSHAGTHYRLEDSPALPKPTQERIPVIVGGHGPKRTPRLAATYASEFNIPFAPLERGARAVRPGARRLRGGWPRPGVADLLLRAGDRGRGRRRRGRPPARRHRAHPRAARPGRRPGRHPRRRSATSSPRGATPAPSAPTCRSSTWPTWSTSS